MRVLGQLAVRHSPALSHAKVANSRRGDGNAMRKDPPRIEDSELEDVFVREKKKTCHRNGETSARPNGLDHADRLNGKTQ
jgi:hypothetical protein